ncbi:hypothetical protein L6164_022725 [Bauhinia variegata]|uniref:Uncharacterized protein n=1 Tax=Bauhinia variegata TaxID=167791 RepID=A0ACB9MJE7_BAUVA|nr:hypothetical protein L6164_022725 [Bauhinia variegata]
MITEMACKSDPRQIIMVVRSGFDFVVHYLLQCFSLLRTLKWTASCNPWPLHPASLLKEKKRTIMSNDNQPMDCQLSSRQCAQL